MTVDPKVYALAESFVDDVLDEFGEPTTAGRKRERLRLIQRAAEAMQQAIEDECEAIRKELQQ